MIKVCTVLEELLTQTEGRCFLEKVTPDNETLRIEKLARKKEEHLIQDKIKDTFRYDTKFLVSCWDISDIDKTKNAQVEGVGLGRQMNNSVLVMLNAGRYAHRAVNAKICIIVVLFVMAKDKMTEMSIGRRIDKLTSGRDLD